MNFIPKEAYEKLDYYLKSHPDTTEIEIRIGSFDSSNKFISNVNKKIFNHIKTSLTSLSWEKGGTLEMNKSFTKVYQTNNVRKIENLETEEPPFFIEKQNCGKFDVYDWDYRISKSIEKNIKSTNEIFYEKFNRVKKRWSFVDIDVEGIFYGTCIDLTQVINYNGNREYETFEVEIERKTKMSVDDFIEKFKFLYFIYQQLDKFFLQEYYKNPKNHQLAKNILNLNFDKVMNFTEIQNSISSFNNSIPSEKKIFNNQIISYRNEPKNIKCEQLFELEDKYAVTSKLDGVRKFLFFEKEAVYMISPVNEISCISRGTNSFVGTILDGEFLNQSNEFYMFDVIRFKKINVCDLDLQKRIKMLETVCRNVPTINHMKLFCKKFYFGNFYESVNLALDENEQFEKQLKKTDGIIIQPINLPYLNNFTYKWKPFNKLTIDFKVSEYGNLLTFEKRDKLIQFKGTNIHSYSQKLEELEFQNESMIDRIMEFSWNGEKFIPTRFRDDRPIPNRNEVAISVWNDIQNPMYESTIRGQDLVLMRKFHNKIKHHLLQKFTKPRSTILDIGSGRGGDIKKWKILNLDVFSIEPDSENIEELKKRLKFYNFESTIINAGGEDLEIIKKQLTKKVDVICVFFSLTFFDDEKQKQFLETIKNFLNYGGYIIGIVLDGEKVKNTVKQKLENNSFSLTISNDKLITNINDETSMVKNVHETLFDFNKFKNLLETENIKLDENYKSNFIDKNIDVLPKDSQIFSSFNRIFVFKREIMDFDIDIHDVIATKNSLLHAIIQPISKKYNETNDKEQYIELLKNKLGEKFEGLNNSFLTQTISDDFENINHISNVLNINIFTLDSDRHLYNGNEKLYSNRKSVIILKEVVGTRNEFKIVSFKGISVFDYSSNIIQNILYQIKNI